MGEGRTLLKTIVARRRSMIALLLLYSGGFTTLCGGLMEECSMRGRPLFLVRQCPYL